ncbi:MAG: ferritin-like domain-containing protein [Polyangiaceae bacterium]
MSSHRITALVLAHLGLVVGCRSSETPPQNGAPAAAPPRPLASAPSATVEPRAPAPSIASASASVAPAASTSAAVAIAASATPTSPKGASGALGKPCGPGNTCSAGLYCQRNFTGAGFLPGGTCVDHPPIYEGRPLVVDGIGRRAPEIGAAWSPLAVRVEARDAVLAEELVRSALEEHASIAAFARTICCLMALGAPEALLTKTAAALADEIRHARDAFALASALGGAPVGPGPLPEAVAPLGEDAGFARALLSDVLRGGCVGESIAAARALARANDETYPSDVRAFYSRIADDEARHAALAFETARFLVGRDPTLVDVVREVRSHFDATTRVLVGEVFSAVFGGDGSRSVAESA